MKSTDEEGFVFDGDACGVPSHLSVWILHSDIVTRRREEWGGYIDEAVDF